MNILVLNYEYPPLGGGGGVACQILAEEYIRQGHQVECVTTQFGDLPSYEIRNGVVIHRVKVLGNRTMMAAGLLSLFSFPICAYGYTMRLCKNKKFDCIHTHFSVPTGLLGIWIKKYFKIPNVLSLHGGDVYDPTKHFSPHRWWGFRKCNEWIFKHMDFIVAQSSMTKKKAETFYRCEKDISVIPLAHNYIDFKICGREDLGLEKDGRYVITVGRLVKRKGYEFLIRSFRYVNNANLLIIGDGPEYSNLCSLIKETGLEKRVTLLGTRYGDEKFQYLFNSDLFVLSSVYEPFGIVLQEAMQVGLPIISTSDGGVGDLIENGHNGLLVNYGDEKGLAESIEYILSNADVKAQMSNYNKVKIKDYAVEKIAKEYLEVLKMLIEDYSK